MTMMQVLEMVLIVSNMFDYFSYFGAYVSLATNYGSSRWLLIMGAPVLVWYIL
jgi:hypothetical protein